MGGLPTHLKLVHHHYTQVTRRAPAAPRVIDTLWDAPCPASDLTSVGARAALP